MVVILIFIRLFDKEEKGNRHLFFIPTFEYFIEGCLHVVL